MIQIDVVGYLTDDIPRYWLIIVSFAHYASGFALARWFYR